MAKGWESKSVEDQQAQSSQPSTHNSEKNDPQQSARLRERQALELQRERILDERTANPIRRAALEAALTEIEAKLSAL